MEKAIKDELIMAYVDGELDDKERVLVERAMKEDDRLVEKAKVFKESRELLQGVYDAPLHEEVPEHLLKMVQTGGMAQAHASKGWWDRLITTFKEAFLFLNARPALMAATAFVFIAAMAGLLYHMAVPWSPMRKATRWTNWAAFQKGMATTPSGEYFFVKKGKIKVSPTVTFRDKEYPYCREFQIFEASKTQTPRGLEGSGIACLDESEGRWKVIAYAPIRPKSTAGPPDKGYELAGTENPIDSLVDKRRIGQPLSKEQELDRIKKGWKP